MDRIIEKSVREGIKKISPYVPGKPVEELQRTYGLKPEKIIKLASNENPLGPSPRALKAVENSAKNIARYPEGSGYYLKKKLAEKLLVPAEKILLGSGSSEIISMAMETFVNTGEEVIYPVPSFLIYKILTHKIGAIPVEVALNSDFSYNLDAFTDKITARTKMVILCNPNNPSGTVIYREQIKQFFNSIPDDVLVIADEAYIEYVEDANFGAAFPYLDKNVIITRTFSKIYGLAGLRIGYGITGEYIAGFMERIRPPFNTTTPAQEAAMAALDDEDHIEKSFENNRDGKNFLYEAFDSMGIEFTPTEANFIFCRLGKDRAGIAGELEKKGIIIRGMDGIEQGCVRITIGTPEENRLLVSRLKEVL